MLSLKLVEIESQLRTPHIGLSLLRKLQEELKMLLPYPLTFPCFEQLLTGILANGLQRAVARLFTLIALGEDDGLVHELHQQVEDSVGFDTLTSTDGFRGLQ